MGWVAFLFLFQCSIAQAFLSTHKAAIEKMTGPIFNCITRKDTTYPIFRGCIDWHSAVHGHWALFRIARALERTPPETLWAENSLESEKLQQEKENLLSQPRFENPYGRAWFLRLAIDFEGWALQDNVPMPKRLRELAAIIATSILDYYQQEKISPFSHEYQNASWAFLQLYAYYDFLGDLASLQRVESIIRSDFLSQPHVVTFGYDKDEFFSVFGNWVYLIAKTQPYNLLLSFLGEHPVANKDLQPIHVTGAHSMGLNWSRAWALSALSKRAEDGIEKERFQAAFETHIAQGLEDHERYKDDYASYGHWVPQFAVYAMTEGFDGGN